MAKYKKHHYIPEHILKNFRNSQNQLFYFNKNKPLNPIEHRNPGKIFCENHLYSYETRDGSKNAEVEFNYFKKVDTDVAPIVQQIIDRVRQGKAPNLTTQNKSCWDEFFIKQQIRSPEHIKSHEFQKTTDSQYEESKNKIYNRLSDEIKLLFDNEEFKRRQQLEARVKSLKSELPNVRKVLSERGLYFARIVTPKKSFVIGSAPLVRMGNGGSNKLNDPKTEFWYPIAHDIAVSMGSYDEREVVGILTDKNTIIIRKVNSQITKQSNEIAGKSKKLISSLLENKNSA